MNEECFPGEMKGKKEHRNRTAVKGAFSIPSICYYVRSTSYLGKCLSYTSYSMTLQIGRDKRKIKGKKH